MINFTKYKLGPSCYELKDPKLLAKIDGYLKGFKNLNIELLQIDGFYVYESISSFGRCKSSRKDSTAVIGVNKLILNDEEQFKNTLLHELCHAAKSTRSDNHGPQWKHVAYKVSRYFNIDITRTFEADENTAAYSPAITAFVEAREAKVAYIITCLGCGNTYTKTRASNVTKNIGNYRCSKCKSNLKVEKV